MTSEYRDNKYIQNVRRNMYREGPPGSQKMRYGESITIGPRIRKLKWYGTRQELQPTLQCFVQVLLWLYTSSMPARHETFYLLYCLTIFTPKTFL